MRAFAKQNSCSLEKKRKIAGLAATILSSMAKALLLPGSEGPDGVQIDGTARLAEQERWLRTDVLARLGERQAVDEVMQEVALAAVAQKAPLNDPARVGAWLYRIAVRQVLLYRRRRGRQRRLIGNYAGLHRNVAAAPDPLDWLLRDERSRLLREALGRLPR